MCAYFFDFGQLQFFCTYLLHMKMDESRLTRQVMSSQGVRTKDTNVKGSKHTSGSVYRNALIRGGVVSEEEKKSCILTDTWTRRLCNPKIGDTIEMKLKLPPGSFCKRKSREPRR